MNIAGYERRRRLIAALLSAVICVSTCGCDNAPAAQGEAEITESQSAEEITGEDTPVLNADEPDIAENSVDNTNNNAENEQVFTLEDLPFGAFEKTKCEMDDEAVSIIGRINSLNYLGGIYISPTELNLPLREIHARRSCRQLGENALSSAKNTLYDITLDFRTASQIVANRTASLTVDSIIKKGSSYTAKISAVKVGVSMQNFKSVRGFIRKLSDTQAECIIDPAFMGGIPMFSAKDEYLTYDINGRTVYADTLSFKSAIDEETSKKLGKNSDIYVYAMFDINYIYISYSSADGYNNSGSIGNLTFLTAATDDVIDSAILFSDGCYATEADMMYEALTANYKNFMTDKTVGVNLADLDADGKAELLVSRKSELCTDTTNDMNAANALDVDVYDITGETLSLIGTMSGITDSLRFFAATRRPYLGLKRIDGDTAWFALTCADEDETEITRGMLFRLIDGKLSEEELFSFSRKGREDTFTIGGKPVEPIYKEARDGTKKPYLNLDGEDVRMPSDSADTMCYSYLKRYTSDITEAVLLYSDWLVPMNMDIYGTIYIGDANYVLSDYIGDTKYELSERDIKFNLVRTIDEYEFSLPDIAVSTTDYFNYEAGMSAMKPIIYLYPEEETDVSVKVSFAGGGKFTCTYPDYGDGWHVTAMPDGTLYDEDGSEYYCLYWEGEGLPIGELNEGFCVSGRDTAAFLREKLLYIGLTPREAEEFIIFWLPQMQDNPYNIITFHFEDYCKAARLDVSPAPDTVIRVFMTFKASEDAADIPPQELPHYEREGFTLVEWGGCEE